MCACACLVVCVCLCVCIGVFVCVCVCVWVGGYMCVGVFVCVRVCFGVPAFYSMLISCFPLNLILVIYIRVDIWAKLLEASDCNTFFIKPKCSVPKIR